MAVAAAALGTVKHGDAARLAEDSSGCGRGTAFRDDFLGRGIVRTVAVSCKERKKIEEKKC